MFHGATASAPEGRRFNPPSFRRGRTTSWRTCVERAALNPLGAPFATRIWPSPSLPKRLSSDRPNAPPWAQVDELDDFIMHNLAHAAQLHQAPNGEISFQLPLRGQAAPPNSTPASNTIKRAIAAPAHRLPHYPCLRCPAARLSAPQLAPPRRN